MPLDEFDYANYKLPEAVQQYVDAWKSALGNGSIVTTLLVATEAQLLSLLPIRDEEHPDTPAISAFRFFSYAGVFVNLLVTLISLFLLDALVNVPLSARSLCLEDETCLPRRLHTNEFKAREEFITLLKNEKGGELLRKFGMSLPWGLTGLWAIFLYIGCGCIFIQLSLYLWLNETHVVSGPLMILVAAALVVTLVPMFFYRRKSPRLTANSISVESFPMVP
ncbi:hypothetical protein FRC02_010118 [Tulasnella sp. 418]|nr:hypothetical protein FRC02_010118 [Tulasnella sp. 418]